MSGTADTGVDGQARPHLSCSELRCTYVGVVPSFISLELTIPVTAGSAGYLGENEMRVEGANAPPQVVRRGMTASEAATPFGVESYELNAEEESGAPDLRAGSHPFQLTTTLEFNQAFKPDPKEPGERPASPALLRNLYTTLPAGLVADTAAIPQCSDADSRRSCRAAATPVPRTP